MMSFKNLGIKLKIMAGGVIPIVLAAILFVVVVFSLQSMLKTISWQDRTHRALRQVVEIQSDTLNMLAWVRGFIITGNQKFIEGFKQVEARVEQEYEQIKKLEADNSELAQMIAQSRDLSEKLRKSFWNGLGLAREIHEAKNMNDMASVVSAAEGERISRFQDRANDLAESLQSAVDKLRNDPATARNPQQWPATMDQHQSYMALKHTVEILAAGLAMEAAERGFLLTGKQEFLSAYDTSGKKAFDLIERQKRIIENMPAQAKLVQEMDDSLKAWQKTVAEPEIALRKQISSAKKMDDLIAGLYKEDSNTGLRQFDENIAHFKSTQENALKEREELSKHATERIQTILMVGIILMILASFFISYFLARAIANPVTEAVNLAVNISKGDLSRTLEKKGEDEVGRLTGALNEMVEFLRDQARRTTDGVNVLGSSAAEISATVSQLVMSTSKTSAAVTETTTTVEQVKQAARISNEKAKKVAEASQQAVQISDSGKKATDDTMVRMNLIKEQMESIGETVVRLSEHSQAIEDIIASVQDLADQSNLLAVNASIEAARAGDQGKGFAVVAHEIKTLADQSKTSTDQVRSILEDTRKWVSAVVMATEQGNKAVEAGVTQSAMAGDSIQALSNSVSASSQAASVIYSSTEQQFVGVDQVSTAMANIQQAMQQNSAGTSQLETAAKRIEELGLSLKDLVARFRM